MRQAERYHAKLETCFEFLANNPKAAHLRLEIAPPVRAHPIGAHIVIYACNEDNGVVILRVRHRHEDWL
jgi:toxin ParE1/3/4